MTVQNKSKKLLNVVAMGGGTGTFVVLSGLKKYPIKLTAIISMMDSGGSTGRLRDQLGVLPPGDIRQALVALSESSQIWRDLFTYRFDNGDLGGHTFGNIFLSAIEKMAGSLPKAIEMSQLLLKTRGTILPVTLDHATLYAKLKNGSVVEGEGNIDKLGHDWKVKVSEIASCWISPQAKATKKALYAISHADYIVVGPGDLYTSLLPNFLVTGVGEAFVKSRARKIFVVNLMTTRGQTDHFKTKDFIKEFALYVKGMAFDYLVVNTGKVSKDVIGWYHQTAEVEPVINNIKENSGLKIVRADVISRVEYGKTIPDRIERSLIRHDANKLAKTLARIMSIDIK